MRLDADLWRFVEAEAARAGLSVSHWLRAALLAGVVEAETGMEDHGAGDTQEEATPLRAEGPHAVQPSRAMLRHASAVMEANLAGRFDLVFWATPDFMEISKLDERNGGAQTLVSWLEAHVHPEDHDVVRTAVDESVRDQAVLTLAHRVLRADGTTGWTVSRAVPLIGPGGEIAEWLVVTGDGNDATPRRRAGDDRR